MHVPGSLALYCSSIENIWPRAEKQRRCKKEAVKKEERPIAILIFRTWIPGEQKEGRASFENSFFLFFFSRGGKCRAPVFLGGGKSDPSPMGYSSSSSGQKKRHIYTSTKLLPIRKCT